MPPRRSARANARAAGTPVASPPPLDAAAIEIMIAERVAAALANHSAARQEGSGQGTNSSQGESRGHPRPSTYKDFSNCKPKAFHGDGGVITLTRWFEKTESIFEICACPNESKVKFAACTFVDAAL
ncbi:hypothetical protein L1887_40436 [Cichorium endivia]|nr:hypothetical protein L1887_40436 [Cichorium endivia]